MVHDRSFVTLVQVQKQRAEELGLVVGLKNDQLRQVLADPLKGFGLVLLLLVC